MSYITFAVVIFQHKQRTRTYWPMTKLYEVVPIQLFQGVFFRLNIYCFCGNKGFVQIWLLLSFLSSVSWRKSFFKSVSSLKWRARPQLFQKRVAVYQVQTIWHCQIMNESILIYFDGIAIYPRNNRGQACSSYL